MEGIARAERRTRRSGPRGRLVDDAGDRERGGRPAPLSSKYRGVSERRSAARRAVEHQIRYPHAAAQAEGSDGTARRSRAARFLRRGSGTQHCGRRAGRRRRIVGRRPRRLPCPSARAAGDSLSRRQGLCDAGTHCGANARACLAPVAGEFAGDRWRTRCLGLRGLRAGSADSLSRTAQGHGRCRWPARAGCGISRAILHHAFLGGRPRWQHRRGNTDITVDLRLQIRDAADRHHHEQRHHVVRSDAGHDEFAQPRQALPDQLHAGAGASRRRPPAGGRRLRRAADHALRDADPLLCHGLRHGSGCCDPPAAHRCERRRGRDRRCAPAGRGSQRTPRALRL